MHLVEQNTENDVRQWGHKISLFIRMLFMYKNTECRESGAYGK
jgi:hypothetical protein